MGLEECLRDQQDKTHPRPSDDSPICYLATWLMRNNPKHSEQGREKLERFQQALLTREELADVAELEGRRAEDAARVVQAAHRGHTARLMAGEQKKAARAVQSAARGRAARREREAEHVAAAAVQSHYRGHVARVEVHAQLEQEQQAQQAAATAVQAVVRGHQRRVTHSAPPGRSVGGEATAAEDEADALALAAEEADAEARAAAATKVQAGVRGRQARAARE